METPLRGWIAILLLALAWGLGPAVPALLRGDLLGHPYTDLYPAVWGLHAFATHQPGLPAWTESLCWPTGMGFYYSSPIHGWLATPLLPLLGLRNTWNVLIVGARIATVLLTYHWLRAEGARPWGALAGAGLYGCAACFHGFAVEGIVEGTDAWTLPLWGWCVARRRPLASIAAFFLVILSSWYLGAGGLVVALFWGGERRLAIGSALIGSILALPLWFTFQGAFPAAAPLSEAVREAMGAVIRIPAPGWAPGLHPFAKTSYIGWLAVVLFGVGARHRPWLAAGAMTCWILSLGRGPWYDLPGLAMVRFPYRFVAGSLFLAAPIVARVIDRIGNTPRFSRFGAWAWLVAPALVLEAWLAAPVEPVIPGASPLVPAAYAHVRPGALLEIPGPVAMPPGVINRSRPRARGTAARGSLREQG